MNKKFKRGLKDERGAVLITVALVLTVLLFFVALVIDIGLAYHTKSKLQAASDSVALSVAHSACDGIADFNPQVYASQSSILINSARVYFEENGIKDFDEILESGKNKNDGNEFGVIWSLDRKDDAFDMVKDDKNVVFIFYDTTPTTDEVAGSRYIEIYAHLQRRSMFGVFTDFDVFNLSAQAAAKCDYIAGGTPEALSYQILNLDPTEDFDITGPIENTFIKSITTFTENMTNSALDFLQNNTRFISKYIMGGQTRFKCPNSECGYVGTESEFWFDSTTDPAAPTNETTGESLDGYYCPKCREEGRGWVECTTENSNKVSVQITTSAAVLNGVVHSNGGANIDIDTFRLRSQLSSAVQSVTCSNPDCTGGENGQPFTGSPEEFAVRYLNASNDDGNDGTEDTIIFLCPYCNTETSISFADYAEQNGITGDDDYFYYYATGSKEGKRPLLMVSKDYGSVNFSGRSKNAVYFAHVQNLSGSTYTSTVYKTAAAAAPWDYNRASSIAQVIYNSPTVEDPLLIPYVRARFNYDYNNNLTTTINVNNIARSKTIPYTKDNSNPVYIVSFGSTTESGTNYSYDSTNKTLSINGTIADYTRMNKAPWCDADYKNEIKHVIINKNVYRIGNYAFFGLSNLESVTISDTVTSIGKYAFSGCSSLTSIYVPSNVTTIDQRAFYNSGVNVFYGEDPSPIKTWCTSNNKNFSSEYTSNTSVVNASGLSFAQVVDSKSILDTYDLGNGKALPSVTETFDYSFNFNFNFDRTKDSLNDVIENTVPQVANDTMSANAFANLNAVEKIVHNKRINLGSGDSFDDDGSDFVRPLIDEKVTDITGVNHNEYDESQDPVAYYDIDIPLAVQTKGNQYKTELFNLEQTYLNLATAARAYDSTNANGVQGNVQQKITDNISNIKGDMFSTVNGVETNYVEANAARLYNLYTGSGTVNYSELISINNTTIASYNATITSNNASITTLQGEISTAQARITTLDGLISTANSDLTTARANKTEKESALETKLGQLNTKQAEYDAAVANGDSQETLDDLQDEIDTLTTDINALQTQITDLEEDIAELEEDIDEYQTERDEKAEIVDSKTVQIQNLQEQNTDLNNKITILTEKNADYQTILDDSVSKLQPAFFNIGGTNDSKIRVVCPTCGATGTVAGGAFTYHSGTTPYFTCNSCNAVVNFGGTGEKNSGYNTEDFIYGRDDIKVFYNGETPVMVEKQANGSYKRLDTNATVTLNSDGTITGLKSSVQKLVENYIEEAPAAPTNDFQAQYNYYTNKYTLNGTTIYKDGVAQSTTVWSAITGKSNSWSTDPHVSGYAYVPYINNPKYSNKGARNVWFDPNSKVYVNANNGVAANMEENSKNFEVQSGTGGDYTYVFFNGSVTLAQGAGDLRIGDNCVVIINGDLIVGQKGWGVYVGSNSILVVTGKIQIKRGGNFVAGGDNQGNIGNNTKVYCNTYYGGTEHTTWNWSPAANNITLGTNSQLITTGVMDLQDGGGTITVNNGAKLSVGGDLWFNNGGKVVLNTSSQMFVHGYMRVQRYDSNAPGDVIVNDGCVLVADGFRIYKGGTTYLYGNGKIIATGNGSGSSDTDDSGVGSYSGAVDCSNIDASTTSTITAADRIFGGNNQGLSAIGNAFVVNTIEATKGNINIYGKAVVGSGINVGGNTTTVKPGAILITPSVTGNFNIDSDENNPTIVVIEKDINTSGNDLGIHTGSTLYCGGSIYAKALRIWPNAKIHADGNIALTDIIDGANASNWVLSCKGDIISTKDYNGTSHGVGEGSYLFCEGKILTPKCNFTNKGTVYCAATDSKKMTWSTGLWTGNGNASLSDDGALYIPDGYIYLSGYEGGSVPITGTTKWKIDFGFRFKTSASGDDAYYNSDDFSFLKMYVYEGNLSNPNQKNNVRCYFSQNANGVCYSWEATPTIGTQSQGTSITANNGNLSVGVNYHYVAEYTGDRIKTYITDERGVVVQNIADSTDSTFLGRLGNISWATINAIKIGDDDGNGFFHGLEYRNITFYSGDAQGVWSPIASSDFTTLHTAVTNGSLGELDTYAQGIRCGHFDNIGGANLYSNGDININGHFTNTGDVYAQGEIITSDYITNNTRAYMCTQNRITTSGVLTNGDAARLYARNGIKANGFTGNAGQYTLIDTGDMVLTGNSTFKGQTHIGGPYQVGFGYLKSTANVTVEGSLTVNGHPYNGDDPIIDFATASRVKGIDASLLTIQGGGKVYCQGQVATDHNVNIYANSGERDEFSCLVIDGGKNKTNSDHVALTVGDRVSMQRNTDLRYSSSQLYVDGNVNVGSYDNQSFYACSNGTFVNVTGKLKLDYGINNGASNNLPVYCYLTAKQLEVTHGDCYFGIAEIRTEDIAAATGFYIGNKLGDVPDNFTAVDVKEGKLHIYTNAYIGGSVSTAGDFALDDWATAYVGGNITSGGGFYQYNSSEAYIGKRVVTNGVASGADGNVTINGSTVSLADLNNFGSVFCTGNFTANNASLTSQGECSLLIDKTLTLGGGVTADFPSGEGVIFARNGINFNAATITVYPIFYTDGNIESHYGSHSTIYAQYVSYVQPNTSGRLINCSVEAQEVVGAERSFEIDSGNISGSGSLMDKLTNLIGTSTTYTATVRDGRVAVIFNGNASMITHHTIKTGLIVSHDCLQLNIARNQTVYVKGFDLIMNYDVYNAGKIICLQDEQGNGGNIIVRHPTGSWAHIENTGTIYCDGDFRVEGTNHGNLLGGVFGAQTNYGLSLKNGMSGNPRGEVYVMGELLTYGAVDNFAKIYVGNDVHTTTLIRGTTEGYSDSGTDNNNGLDNEPNSVLMAGGSITADINPDNNNAYNTAVEKSSGTHYDETIIARRNSVLLALGNVRCSYGFIVGEARMDSTSSGSENGTKQFQWLSMQGYTGLNASKAGWIKTTAEDTREKIQLTSLDETSEYYYLNYQGDTYNEFGQAIDVTDENNKNAYYYYSAAANGRSSVTAKDFGFAYIGGTLTTSNGGYNADSYSGTHNFIRNFGKSVIYVANNTIDDGYRNPRGNAVDTGYTTLWPYSRMYVNGNYKNNLSPTSDSGSTTRTGVGLDAGFYAQLYVNGDFTAYDKIKMRDASKTIIAGDFYANRRGLDSTFFELGKSPDEGEREVKEAWDENNLTLLQINGSFTSDGYIKIFERATMNVGGDFTNLSGWSITNHYLTMRHHSALRVGGTATVSAADVGSCSTLYVGKDFNANNGTIKIRDNCDVSVGGTGGGDMTALSYIEIGKREDEAYKYNSWEANRGTNPFISADDIRTDDETHFADTDTDGDSTGDENYATADVTCPNCGRSTTNNTATFTRSTRDAKDANGRTMYTVYQFTCSECGYTFDESSDAFEDDGAVGATAYVNGTINSKTGHLKLFANTHAYAVETVRSYRYISLRHHAGLYVLTNTNNGTGSMFSYDDNGRLLDANGNVIPNFYVDTNTNSTEYGNIYYWKSGQDLIYQQDVDGVLVERQLSLADDGTPENALYTSGVRIYGFTVKINEENQESFNNTTSDNTAKGTLYQNMLYFYLNGEKVYPYQIVTGAPVNNVTQDYLIYAHINAEYNLVQDANDRNDYLEKPVGTAVVKLPVTSGSIISYGDLTVNTQATAYATGDVKSYGKTYIGNEGLIFSKGDYLCTSVASLGSLFKGESVCGFEMKHGHLYAAGKVNIYSASEIGGGTIDAGKDVTFDSVYMHYKYNEDTNPLSNSYTDPTEVDLFICSEQGNINFNSTYSYTGGITYAPGAYAYTTNSETGKTEMTKSGGVISINGIYFEHYGAFIARDNNINAFYINLHRLANLKTLDLKTVSPSNVYLCPIESADNN